MDTPQNNVEGYRKGSILNMISGFPDECGRPVFCLHLLGSDTLLLAYAIVLLRAERLLIVHGLIDENVHFWYEIEGRARSFYAQH